MSARHFARSSAMSSLTIATQKDYRLSAITMKRRISAEDNGGLLKTRVEEQWCTLETRCCAFFCNVQWPRDRKMIDTDNFGIATRTRRRTSSSTKSRVSNIFGIQSKMDLNNIGVREITTARQISRSERNLFIGVVVRESCTTACSTACLNKRRNKKGDAYFQKQQGHSRHLCSFESATFSF